MKKFFCILFIFMSFQLYSLTDDEVKFLKACENGKYETVVAMLDRKVNVNVTTEDGLTGLMLASHKGYPNIVKLLIRHNADVNIVDNVGYNALIFAMYGLAGIIRLAYFNINATADTPVKNYTGLPVTTAAAIFPALFLVSLLISKEHFLVVATIVNALVGILFISKIKIAKPKGNALYVFLAAAIIFIFYMLKLIFL